MSGISPVQLAIIIVLVLLVVLSGGLAFVIYLRKKRKTREAARQKLVEEQTRQVSYDSTSPEYRNLYKKALLKASQEGSIAVSAVSSGASKRSNFSGDLEAQTPALSTARSTARSTASAPVSAQATPRPELEDSEIFSVAIGSWYEHLIRHSTTEYLRSIVKAHPEISERDLVPEMRLLLENCPGVPLVRWSKLSNEQKAQVSKVARDMKDAVVGNLQRRLGKNRAAA
jgi:hypothetical protein